MSMTRIASAASAAIFLGTLAASGASAMPLGGLKPAAEAVQTTAQNVAWVCGPYRCWWQPNYAYWGPRSFYGPRFHYGPRPYRFGWYGHGPRRYWR
jgi:hypothetical protein